MVLNLRFNTFFHRFPDSSVVFPAILHIVSFFSVPQQVESCSQVQTLNLLAHFRKEIGTDPTDNHPPAPVSGRWVLFVFL